MPHDYRVQVTGSGGAVGSDDTIQVITGEAQSREDPRPTIPAAKVGELTARTDANTGSVTFDTGHGFTTGNKIDLFWTGGSRRNMTATVTGDVAALDGGSGDDLPALNTAVTGMVPVEVPFTVDGAEVKYLALRSPVAAFIVFVDDADAEIADATFTIPEGGGGQTWAVDLPQDNPFGTSVTSVAKFSHGSTTAQDLVAMALFGDV